MCGEEIFMRTFLALILLSLCAAAQDQFSALRTRAESGDAAAALELAHAYESGKGVRADRFVAADWYKKAAEAGHAEAQNITGIMLRTGDGGRKDPEEALKWFRMAAKQGYADAMFNIGTAYYNGDGVAVSDPIATAWFAVAQEFGSEPAADAVRRSLAETPAFKSSDGLIRAAAMLIEGKEVPQRPGAAAPWLQKAADLGNRSATIKLAELYLNGIGVPRDVEKGADYCEQGAKAGLPSGMACMGYIYRNGKGRPVNLSQAVNWYKKGAGCGEAGSVVNLSHMYVNGEGVKQDRVEAYALLLLAGDALPEAKQEAEKMRSSLSASELKKADKEAREFVPKNRPKECAWD
jgi:TPR repeat protein